jgi:hypothetical protein
MQANGPTASEFTAFFPMKPGSQVALREVLRQAEPLIAQLLERLQTVHDMRWVFIPGDR